MKLCFVFFNEMLYGKMSLNKTCVMVNNLRLQSYYVSGRQLLNDAEFDLLKEDLSWNGSSMVNMNRKETQYLTAVQDYLKGKPSLSDAEFDKLKTELQEEGSQFASAKEPRCYIGE